MIDAKGCLVVRPIDGDSGNLEEWGEAPWEKHADSIASVKIEKDVIASTARDMFYGCSSLASLDLSGLDTSDVTDMSGMFYGCSSLTSLDLSAFDTSKVEDMDWMFYGCSSLTSLDVSGFDTSKVKDMSHMFSGCLSLASLGLSSFDTSSVTDMSDMFYGCSSIASLDLSNFDTSNVASMGWMFDGCSSLRSVTLGGRFSFGGGDADARKCSLPAPSGDGLTGRWLSSVDGIAYEPGGVPSGVAATYRAQRDGDGAWNQYGTCVWRIDADGRLEIEPLPGRESGELADWGYGKAPWLAFATEIKEATVGDGVAAATAGGMFRGCASMVSADLSQLDTSGVTDTSHMFYGCSSLVSLDLSHFNTSSVTSMSGMFSGCSSLTSLDLSSFDTSKVKNMGAMYEPDRGEGMFSGCSSLESLDLSSFNTPAAVCMSFMFYGCSSLASLDLSGFGTSAPAKLSSMFYGCSSLKAIKFAGSGKLRVSTSSSMFYGCSKLAELDLSSFDTSNATSTSGMFSGCSSLASLDLACLDTSNVTSMSHMFSGCSSLASLDLSSFDTSKVTSMDSMFSGCSKLTSLDLSSFNTSSVKEDSRSKGVMTRMFSGCLSLESLDLSSFDTSKVRCMDGMFEGCLRLKDVNLSSFNFSNATSMSYMLQNCQSLEAIEFPAAFDTSKVTGFSSMFSGCRSLERLDVSRFDTSAATSLGFMFSGCSKLASLDVSGFKVSGNAYIGSMFSGCSSLTSLDLSGFDTSGIASAYGMSGLLTGCDGLRAVTLGPKFSFEGAGLDRQCSLPTPTGDGLTGLWISSADGKAYTSDNIPSNVAATYTAQTKGETPKIAINKNMFTVDTSAKTYTGLMIMPEVSSKTLQKGNDYTVSYGPNVNAGAGTVTISGIGDYIGTLGYSFPIDKATPRYTAPSGLTAVYGQTLGDVALPAGFSWQDGLSTKVGDVGHRTFLATYTPVDAANYETVRGIEVGLDVAPAALGEGDFSFDLSDAVYTGEAVTGRVESKSLVAGKDYNVAYSGNVNAGTATIEVTGAGNYEGSKITKHFTIAKADPSYTAPGSINATEGQTLGDLKLPDGFSWQDELTTSVGEAGERTFKAKFVPVDAANYNTVENIDVTVAVSKDDDGWSVCGTCVWRIDGDGMLVIKPANGISGELEKWKGTYDEPDTPWRERASEITSVKVESGVVAPSRIWGMFAGCSSLVSADLKELDAAGVNDIGLMFRGCSSLDSVEFPESGMPRVDDVQDAFADCASLESVDLSFLKGAAIRGNMEGMFYGCSALRSVSLSGLDTSKVTGMANLLRGCSSLESVELSEIDTSAVTSMNCMFRDCASLTSLDLSTFRTDQLVGMNRMFEGCSSLAYLNLSSFDTSKLSCVENRQGMVSVFSGCASLKTVVLGENFTFNGSGAERQCSLPTGNWIDAETGEIYAADEVPNNKAATYNAQEKTEPTANDIGNGNYSYVITSGWYHSGVEGYTGKPIAPKLAVCTRWSGDDQLRENVDYVFRGWRDADHRDLDGAPTEIGTYYVVFDGVGDYTGTLEGELKIVDPSDLGSGLYRTWESSDDGNGDDVLWTGEAVEPDMQVVRCDTGDYLSKGVDFDIKGYLDSEGNELESAPSAVGEYTVVLAGKGSYTGELKRTIYVRSRNSLHFARFSFYNKTFAYTGEPIDLGLEVTSLDGEALEEGVDYRILYGSLYDWWNAQPDAPSAVGDYRVTVEAIDGGKCVDSVSWIFASIKDVTDIGDAGLTVNPVTYTGYDNFFLDVRDPATGNRLSEGDDFEIKGYLDSEGNELDGVPTSVGKYTAIIEGKGLYEGEVSLPFEIVPAQVSGRMVSGIPKSLEYTGSQLTPEPTMMYGRPLTKGVDYHVVYGPNTDVGQLGTLKIVGKGNFAGELDLTFGIYPKQIDAPEVVSGLVYSGEEQTGVAPSGEYSVTGGSATNAGNYIATVSLNDKKNCAWAGAGDSDEQKVGWSSDDLTVEWSIAKADPPHKITGAISAKEGQTLGDLELPDGFSWQDELTTSVGEAGERTFKAKFVPKDRVNYNVVEDIPVRVSVSKYADGWTIIGDCAWKIDDQGCLVIKPADGVSGTLENCAVDVEDSPYDLYPVWFGSRSAIMSARFEPGVKASADGLDFLFAHCGNLKTVDLSNLDTTEVTSLKHTFYRCESLNSIAGLGSSGSKIKPQNMHEMCAGCVSLESFDFSGIDGSDLTEANNLFSGCTSLKSIDFKDFSASGMKEFGGVFANCTSLTAIDLSRFNVANASYFYGAFQNCSSLKSLDFSKFDTRRAWVMSNMLEGCSSLESVTLGENFTFDGSGTKWICSLPTPSGELYTGKWVDVETGAAYSAADVPDGKAATYRAQRRLLESDFAVDASDAVYSGRAVAGRVSSDSLTEGVDYDVAYSGNEDAGTASVSIAGKGIYAGELSYSFAIAPAGITADMISGVPSKMEATGGQLMPEPTVTFNGVKLAEGKDYAVSYGENVGPGAGTVTVAAVEGGNFTGSVTVEFDIEKKADPESPDPGTGGGTDPAPTPDPGTGGGSGGGGGAPAPEPQQFSVTYHLDGGANAASNPATYAAGTAIALAAPTREGYEFQGWYADAGFAKRVTEIAADAAGDVELWAKWAKKAPAPVFPDVDYSESSWYGKAVTYVAEKGLIMGYTAGEKVGQFGVGDALTRAQLATILWRNACPEEAASYDPSSAKDETGIAGSADGQYYTAAANWAVANGVISGYDRPDGAKDFAANDDVTFEQLVTILARLCAAPGELDSAGTDLSAFADGSDASPWSRAAFAWAAKKGLVEGYDTASGRLLAPGEDVARERVAVVLMRAFETGILK